MENLIPVSYLNDFIFCPRSIYFHRLYEGESEYLYHSVFQSEGRAAHKNIDTQRYSSQKNILQGTEVVSCTYGLIGKIDLFFTDRCLLRERKKHISVIYDGYILQLYAQYYALTEMGYQVKKMELYSSDTNKIFSVKLPEEDLLMKQKFENIIKEIKAFSLSGNMPAPSVNKCMRCIYCALCDIAPC